MHPIPGCGIPQEQGEIWVKGFSELKAIPWKVLVPPAAGGVCAPILQAWGWQSGEHLPVCSQAPGDSMVSGRPFLIHVSTPTAWHGPAPKTREDLAMRI